MIPATLPEPSRQSRLRAAAPAMRDALLLNLTLTGHTEACSQMRFFGSTECTRACRATRLALQKAGEEVRDYFAEPRSES